MTRTTEPYEIENVNFATRSNIDVINNNYNNGINSARNNEKEKEKIAIMITNNIDDNQL